MFNRRNSTSSSSSEDDYVDANDGINDNDSYGASWAMEGVVNSYFGGHFSETYACRPVEELSSGLRQQVEFGGKVVMPASALEVLSRLNISYPIMFRVFNAQRRTSTATTTHAGVLEFSAPEGLVYLPNWMMQTIGVGTGGLVCLENVSLPLGTFLKLQPQSVDFLDITDPRAVLEQSLRSFSAMTPGDRIRICYNDRQYELLVRQTKPSSSGISVVETDIQVDFEAPPGYREPSVDGSTTKSLAASLEASSFLSGITPNSAGGSFAPFKGQANRLASKKTAEDAPQQSEAPLTIGALNLPADTLYFGGGSSSKKAPTNESNNAGWKAFEGKGNKLK